MFMYQRTSTTHLSQRGKAITAARKHYSPDAVTSFCTAVTTVSHSCNDMRTVYLLIVACQQLEDRCLWLVDRLVDNGLLSVIYQPLSRCNTTHCALAGRYGRFFH